MPGVFRNKQEVRMIGVQESVGETGHSTRDWVLHSLWTFLVSVF